MLASDRYWDSLPAAMTQTHDMQMGDAPAPAAAGGRGGFGRGFGDRGGERGRGDRGRGRGDRGRGRGRGKRDDEEAWVPCTKLGRLVQQGKVRSLLPHPCCGLLQALTALLHLAQVKDHTSENYREGVVPALYGSAAYQHFRVLLIVPASPDPASPHHSFIAQSAHSNESTRAVADALASGDHETHRTSCSRDRPTCRHQPH